MILKASKRSGGKQLGLHLLKTEENEHVEIHDVSGFVSDTVMGAMNEIYALSQGTRCKQYLFSMSLNPPAGESVRVEVFETALSTIEERLGLVGQPRVVVFHEKEGRRHAHAVWSRIDAETMTAKDLPFFKNKLKEVAKQLYLENGWQMPKGFADTKLRDPRNFTLDEWQKAKRVGIDPRQLKSAVLECWAMSDNVHSFSSALEERGLFLAKGDRRGYVAVTMEGEVFAIARLVDKKAKDIAARLGDAGKLRTVDDTKQFIGREIAPKLAAHIADAKRIAANAMRPLHDTKLAMKAQHQVERAKLDQKQKARWNEEQRARSSRLRKGIAGAWDFITGRYSKVRKQNELEASFALQRDRVQRHDLIRAQMKDRQTLQEQIVEMRSRHAMQLLNLYRTAAHYRKMRDGERERDKDRGGRTRDTMPRPPRRDRGLDLG